MSGRRVRQVGFGHSPPLAAAFSLAGCSQMPGSGSFGSGSLGIGSLGLASNASRLRRGPPAQQIYLCRATRWPTAGRATPARASPRSSGSIPIRSSEAGDADVGLRLSRGQPLQREPRRRALPRILPRRRRRTLCAVPDRALLLRPDRRHRPRPVERLRPAAGDARHHRALSQPANTPSRRR